MRVNVFHERVIGLTESLRIDSKYYWLSVPLRSCKIVFDLVIYAQFFYMTTKQALLY